MMQTILFVLLALVLNSGAGVAAWARGSVTAGGAIAGALVGSAILIAGGFVYWIALMLFFVSSSLASRLGARRKEALERMHEKGSRRDTVQVVANGGVAAIAVVLLRVTGNAAYGIAAAAAFAGVNADTWASELGVLSPRRPRSIITWRELEPGTSGGVSVLGTAFAAAGAGLIAGWFVIAQMAIDASPFLATVADPPRARLGFVTSPGTAALAFLIVAAGGFLGMTIDSLLGATVQAQYRGEEGSVTERRMGSAGPHERVRGLALMTNDTVNFASALVAAAASGALWLVLVA